MESLFDLHSRGPWRREFICKLVNLMYSLHSIDLNPWPDSLVSHYGIRRCFDIFLRNGVRSTYVKNLGGYQSVAIIMVKKTNVD